jgi:hypothetical protein
MICVIMIAFATIVLISVSFHFNCTTPHVCATVFWDNGQYKWKYTYIVINLINMSLVLRLYLHRTYVIHKFLTTMYSSTIHHFSKFRNSCAYLTEKSFLIRFLHFHHPTNSMHITSLDLSPCKNTTWMGTSSILGLGQNTTYKNITYPTYTGFVLVFSFMLVFFSWRKAFGVEEWVKVVSDLALFLHLTKTKQPHRQKTPTCKIKWKFDQDWI